MPSTLLCGLLRKQIWVEADNVIQHSISVVVMFCSEQPSNADSLPAGTCNTSSPKVWSFSFILQPCARLYFYICVWVKQAARPVGGDDAPIIADLETFSSQSLTNLKGILFPLLEFCCKVQLIEQNFFLSHFGAFLCSWYKSSSEMKSRRVRKHHHGFRVLDCGQTAAEQPIHGTVSEERSRWWARFALQSKCCLVLWGDGTSNTVPSLPFGSLHSYPLSFFPTYSSCIHWMPSSCW